MRSDVPRGSQPFCISTPVTRGNSDSQMADTGQPCPFSSLASWSPEELRMEGERSSGQRRG